MARVHKTMRGVTLNMDQIAIKNEKTIAMGNMKVNAAGDSIGSNGVVVKSASQRIKEQNELHSMVPTRMPVASSSQPEPPEPAAAAFESDADKILADAGIPTVVSDLTPPPSKLSQDDINNLTKE